MLVLCIGGRSDRDNACFSQIFWGDRLLRPGQQPERSRKDQTQMRCLYLVNIRLVYISPFACRRGFLPETAFEGAGSFIVLVPARTNADPVL